jgi:hypothetical protein
VPTPAIILCQFVQPPDYATAFELVQVSRPSGLR